MNFRRVLIVVITLVILMSVSVTGALAQDPDNGQMLWEQDVWQCQQCHGAMGEGAWSRPLSNSELTAEEWVAQVRNPERFMPAFFESQVTDEQIADMHAYITAQPEPAADFEPLDPGMFDNEGQNLMAQKRCIACHADEIETGQGRLIDGFIERSVVPDAQTVIDQLRQPFTFMPAYNENQVSDEEAALMADYLAQAVTAQMDGGADDEAVAEGSDETMAAETETGAETTEEASPETLPQSGGQLPNYALVLMGVGTGLLLAGFVARRRQQISG